MPFAASQLLVCTSRCDRLATATGPSGGTSRTRSPRVFPPDTSTAPRPTTPRKNRSRAGASTRPITGTPFCTRPILTVKAPLPSGRRNSRVPSTGSTRKNCGDGSSAWLAAFSSDTTGMSEASSASAASNMASAASSASDTGDPSGFSRATTPRAWMAMILSPACCTGSTRASSNCWHSGPERSMCCPPLGNGRHDHKDIRDRVPIDLYCHWSAAPACHRYPGRM